MKKEIKRMILTALLAVTVCLSVSCGDQPNAGEAPAPPTGGNGQIEETKDPYEGNESSDGGIWTGVHGK